LYKKTALSCKLVVCVFNQGQIGPDSNLNWNTLIIFIISIMTELFKKKTLCYYE